MESEEKYFANRKDAKKYYYCIPVTNCHYQTINYKIKWILLLAVYQDSYDVLGRCIRKVFVFIIR